MEKTENREGKAFSVWIGNVNAYASGDLTGEWVDVPTSPDTLEGALARIGGEKQMAFDYDIPEKYGFLHDIVSEYSGPEELNLLGAMLEGLSRPELEAVEAYAESNGSMGLPELLNVVAQADAIPYFPYKFDGMERAENISAEEAYGYMAVENGMPDLKSMLENYHLENYLDYEAIGRDANMSGTIQLCGNGYLNLAEEGPDLALYTVDELKAEYGLAADPESVQQEAVQAADRHVDIKGPRV